MTTETFNYTGSVQSWTSGKDQTITVRIEGAGGGDGGDSSYGTGGNDGRGGLLEFELDVVDGQTLDLYVPAAGGNGANESDSSSSGGTGGWGWYNGGDGGDHQYAGAGGGGGGSASVLDSAGNAIGIADAGGGGGGAAESSQGSWGSGGGGGARGGLGGNGDTNGQDAGGSGEGGDGGDGGTNDSGDGNNGGDGGYTLNQGSFVSGSSWQGGRDDGVIEITYPDYPAAPENLVVDATTDTTADLSWTDKADSEDGFHIWRATSSGSTKSDYNQVAEIASINTESYTDTELHNGEQFFYRVTAYNADGDSNLSNEDTGTTTLPALTNMVVDAVNGNQFDLSAQDNANWKDGYRVYRNRDIYYGSHFDSGMGNFTGGFVTDTTQSHDGGQSAYSPGGEFLITPDFTVPSGVIENVAWHRIGALGTNGTHLQAFMGTDWCGPHVAAYDDQKIKWHDGTWNSTGQIYPLDQWFYTRTVTDVAAGTFDCYYFDPSSMTKESQIITGGAFITRDTFAAGDVRNYQPSSKMGTKTWHDTITGVLQSGYTQDGTDITPRYSIQFRADGEHTTAGTSLAIEGQATSFTVVMKCRSLQADVNDWGWSLAKGAFGGAPFAIIDDVGAFDPTIGDSAGNKYRAGDAPYPYDEGFLFALAYDRPNGNMENWVNRTLESQNTNVGQITVASNTNNLTLSEGGSAGWWKGDVQEIWIYSDYLDGADQKAFEMDNAPTTNLEHHWRFDGGSGTTSVPDDVGTAGAFDLLDDPVPIWGKPCTQIPYTTTNLLDGEKYALKADIYTEHRVTEDI